MQSMKLFNFLTNKNKTAPIYDLVPESVDKSGWRGDDFRLLITGAGQIEKIDYDNLMTPKTVEWTRMGRIRWPIYKIEKGHYSFSCETHGIEIVFTNSISFQDAKKIGDEILEKLSSSGHFVNLHVLVNPRVYLKHGGHESTTESTNRLGDGDVIINNSASLVWGMSLFV